MDKASESDISGFQAFTVRNLDNKLSTDTDIEQYKLLNVREDPISNRQEHLDVMCFATLFLTGKFGKNHLASTHVRLNYLTVSTINQGYYIKILGSENMHHMFFIYFGRKICGNSLQMCTI